MVTSDWEFQSILDYIGSDYARCLYLYIDFCVYGQRDNPNVAVYIDRTADGKLHAVLLSYYTSLHIYSRDPDYYSDEVLSLIRQHKPTTIFAVAPIARALSADLSGYTYSEGTVGKLAEKSRIAIKENISELPFEVLPQVADLLIDGQNFAGRYNGKQVFLNQIRERYRNKMGRHYALMGGDGTIAAHAATYAEYKNIAVASGIYTAPAFRRKGLALQTYAMLCNALVAEGKEVFAYYWAEHTAEMHHKIGFKDVCKWGEWKKE